MNVARRPFVGLLVFLLPMKLGRNDPCWCGSGQKYKYCHLNRENQEPQPISEYLAEVRRVQRRPMCLHFAASKANCSDKKARAHTVQEAVLRTIARDGHVYGFSLDPGALQSSKGEFIPRLIGVDKASTFTGFCTSHDSELFSEIENNEIEGNEHHACLLAYRATCRELYAKQSTILLENNTRKADIGRPLHVQMSMQNFFSQHLMSSQVGLDEIKRDKSALEEMLRAKDYSSMRYGLIWFERPPDIMCSSGDQPEYDFHGNMIQDLADANTPAHGISISLLSSGKRGCAFFSWLAQGERSSFCLLSSLLTLGSSQIPHAIVRLVSGYENQFWRPEWWESLDENQQEWIVGRLKSAADLSVITPSNYLMDDGMRLVPWKVVGFDSNNQGLLDLARTKL